MAQLLGRVLSGNYRIDAFLGRGGMADVYKVWDQRRAAFLAAKVLHDDLARDAAFISRFRQEAQTLSSLQHPHIVRSYGLVEDSGLAYLLMDFVEGTTLRDEILLGRRPLAAQRVLEIMRPICSALHFAHQSGFVHCDIKPSNIMIQANGTVLVSDFGIARRTDAASAAAMVGTPAYMAPEQARGASLTPQTDIYALGIVLFEMLSGGKRPFTGENSRPTGSTRERILWEQQNQRPPSLRSLNSDVGPEMEAVVARCLEKNPRHRYANVQELMLALERPLLEAAAFHTGDAAKVKARPAEDKSPAAGVDLGKPRRGQLNAWPWIVAGVALVVLALTMAGGGDRPASVVPVLRVSPAPLPTMASFIGPTPSSLPLRPFKIRPYNASTDTDADCITCRISDWVDPTEPGSYVWSADFPASTPVLVLLGWCADTQQRLDATWPLIHYDALTVDGQEIQMSELQLRRWTNESNAPCYAYTGVLTDWAPGAHVYRQVLRYSQTLFDGWQTYSAGQYTYDFRVNVR